METFGARHRRPRRGRRSARSTRSTRGPASPGRRSRWAARTEADRAVTAARTAFDEGPWPRMGFAERGALIHRFADLLLEHVDELALADTRDMGKPISDARGKDVPRAAQNFRFFADHARLATAEALPMDTGHHAYTRYEPAGRRRGDRAVELPARCSSAGRWRPRWRGATPSCSSPPRTRPRRRRSWPGSRWRRASRRACSTSLHGYGPNSAGSALTEDPRVDRITFTGESNTGRAITGAAARNLTPVSLELGGKGANLVFADADLDTAVDWSIKAIFSNAGQVCLAGSRLYVERAVLDEFLARFVAAAEALRIGDPKDPATELGPLASEDALHEGPRLRRQPAAAKILTGGLGDGWVVKPTIVVDVPGRRPDPVRGGVRPGRHGHPVRHRGRGDPRRQRHPVRAQRHDLHREPVTGAPRRGRGCGPARSGRTASSSGTCARRSAGSATPVGVARAATSAGSSSPSPRPS